MADASQVDNLRRVLDAVLELHEQKPAKAEYREDANGNIIGLEMTYWCDECSHRGFKDYPCDTRKLIESERGI